MADSQITQELAGTTSVTALLEKLGVEAHDLKAVWLPLPCCKLVVPKQFGDEFELGEGVAMCTELIRAWQMPCFRW
ncbi:MAG: hypothetical protein IJ125_03645 [Atopobiaceae bacterium]|nr:hypothetical protein [Atopobiaceae bacterium]